jgi:hypothetical protein
MKRHLIPLALAACAAAGFTPLAGATPVAIHSPQTAQTYADASILWHQLRWLSKSQTLVASITFSNLNYASKAEPRQDERFDFALPGVKFDATNGTFYVIGSAGERIPVAAKQHDPLGYAQRTGACHSRRRQCPAPRQPLDGEIAERAGEAFTGDCRQ